MRVPSVPILRDIGSSVANLFLREVRNFLTAVAGQSILWGNPVEVTFSGAVTVTVPHGLSRAPLGYIVVGSTAALVIRDGGTPTPTSLPLTSSGAGTVRLWVY